MQYEKNLVFLITAFLFPFFGHFYDVRRLLTSKIRRGIRGVRNDGYNRSWFKKIKNPIGGYGFIRHSMGEFEQAKTYYRRFTEKVSRILILLWLFFLRQIWSFKNYKLADIITYIPFDTKSNARRFLDLLQPTAAVFVRYDVWPNHLWEWAKEYPTYIAMPQCAQDRQDFIR